MYADTGLDKKGLLSHKSRPNNNNNVVNRQSFFFRSAGVRQAFFILVQAPPCSALRLRHFFFRPRLYEYANYNSVQWLDNSLPCFVLPIFDQKGGEGI